MSIALHNWRFPLRTFAHRTLATAAGLACVMASQVSARAQTAGTSADAGAAPVPTTRPADDKRPNIVVILVDDMGFADIGCYGSEIQTPNLDALASQGIRLREFYNAGRCCPTRASLLTGLWSHEAGVGHMTSGDRPAGAYQGFLNRRSVTFAEALRPAGYATLMVGKWHVGGKPNQLPTARGFDRFFGSPAGGFYYRSKLIAGNALFRDAQRLYADASELPEDFYSTDAWTDEAIGFVDEATTQHKPFVLYVAHNAPHFPVQAPADLVEKYRGKYKVGWEPMREARIRRQQELGLIDHTASLTPLEDDVPEWSALNDAEKDRYDGLMASYAACVERMDYNVGRLVEHLKQNGEFENTLILFMSDNGGNAEGGLRGTADNIANDRWGGPESRIFVGKCWAALNSTPFRKFKHYVHEGGVSTPLIMSWPARIDPALRGSVATGTGHVVDVMPTLLEAAAATYPTTNDAGRSTNALEGASLLPLLAGKPLTRSEPLFWEHEGNAALRVGALKLVRIEGKNWELYDIAADRGEMHDLATARPDDVRSLSARWQTIADRIGVKPWNEVSNDGRPARRERQREATSQPAATQNDPR